MRGGDTGSGFGFGLEGRRQGGRGRWVCGLMICPYPTIAGRIVAAGMTPGKSSQWTSGYRTNGCVEISS